MPSAIARHDRPAAYPYSACGKESGAAKTALLTVWLAVLLFSCAAASTLDPRGVQSETFGNGLRLIVASDADSPVVAVEVVVRVGSADEPPTARGAAHLLEHVLWAGAGTGTGEADPRLRVEGAGGVINGGTLRDFTRFYATVPAGRYELAVGSLADVVVGSAIDPAVVARERTVIAREAASRQDDPRSALSDAAFAALFGADSPYGSPVAGDTGGPAADVAALALFRRTWYVPNNMAVVVAGNVSFAAARAAVERAFGGMPPSPLPERSTGGRARPAHEAERPLQAVGPSAYVMAAFPGPEAAEHSSVAASDLLATLLAHDPVGRLVVELRERRGLASEVGVEFLTQRHRSLFGVWVVCDSGKVEEVKAAVRAELARLARTPVPVAELAAAKRLVAAGYAFANETPSDRASTLGFYEAIDSYRAASSYLSWLADLSAEELIATAARYSGEPTWVVLTPGSAEQ